MSSAPYGICLTWRQKCERDVELNLISLCWVMLSWMCGFGVSAIVKQQPRRTPPLISIPAAPE
ncbi:hypothetical protein QUA00_12695 [Microcoleus sp. T2B6]|uniref:hypothetical protein n=1 Tax=Microcoleus sp. T2B6 TaxID=3055424 RepID=UPI002FD020F0